MNLTKTSSKLTPMNIARIAITVLNFMLEIITLGYDISCLKSFKHVIGSEKKSVSNWEINEPLIVIGKKV